MYYSSLFIFLQYNQTATIRQKSIANDSNFSSKYALSMQTIDPTEEQLQTARIIYNATLKSINLTKSPNVTLYKVVLQNAFVNSLNKKLNHPVDVVCYEN